MDRALQIRAEPQAHVRRRGIQATEPGRCEVSSGLEFRGDETEAPRFFRNRRWLLIRHTTAFIVLRLRVGEKVDQVSLLHFRGQVDYVLD